MRCSFEVRIVGAGYVGLVVTEWEEILTFELGRGALLMEEPKVLVDGRNVLDPAEVGTAGISYRGSGREYGFGHSRSQEEAGAA